VTPAEYLQAEEEARDSAALLTLCAFCEWTYTGTALEGREEALQHRAEAHPQARRKRRSHNRHLSHFRQPRITVEDQEDIVKEIRKRAFLNGVDLEAETVQY